MAATAVTENARHCTMTSLLPLRILGTTSRLALGHGAPVSSTWLPIRRWKASVANIKQLRKETSLPVTVCRQALVESGDDVTAALKWISENEDLKNKYMQPCTCRRLTTATGPKSYSRVPQPTDVFHWPFRRHPLREQLRRSLLLPVVHTDMITTV